MSDNYTVDFTGAVNAFNAAIVWTTQDRIGSTMSAVGLIFIGLGCMAFYKLIKTEPDDIRVFSIFSSFVILALGLMMFTMGPVFAAYYKVQSESAEGLKVRELIAKKHTDEDRLQRLHDNSEVRWLVRFVVDTGQPDLSLDRLESLGTSNQRYTFVADYDDLKGYTAEDAAKMSGVSVNSGDRVSAIIFPIGRRSIYPANARGLLQVVNDIEQSTPANPLFDVKSKLKSEEAIADFSKTQYVSDWSWDNFSPYFAEYCAASYELVCGSTSYPVSSKIGSITVDWMPQGYAKKKFSRREGFCANKSICDVRDWAKVKDVGLKNFGTRMFLIKNERISDIGGRFLIDFDQPSKQLIPIIMR